MHKCCSECREEKPHVHTERIPDRWVIQPGPYGRPVVLILRTLSQSETVQKASA